MEPIQTYSPEWTERTLREAGKCDHQTGYGMPWFEYCGNSWPCREHS